jgi:hypothetical protein
MKGFFVYFGIIPLLLGCYQQSTENIQSDNNFGFSITTPTKTDSVVCWANNGIYQTSIIGPYIDASSQIETRLYSAMTYGENNDVKVEVGSDEVLIGGGAYVVNNPETLNCGGMLTASFPDRDQVWYQSTGVPVPYAKSWHARSSVPSYADSGTKSHCLYVRAIGMKLKKNYPMFTYMTRAEMLKYIRYTVENSYSAAHPSATAGTSTGYRIISGGGEVVGSNNYLTESIGVVSSSGGSLTGWRVSAKDHFVSSPASLRVYAIHVPNNNGNDNGSQGAIPEFGNFNIWVIDMNHPSTNTVGPNKTPLSPRYMGTSAGQGGWLYLNLPVYDTVGGYDSNVANCLPYLMMISGNPITWTISGIGGSTTYNSSGRMLTKIWPSDGNHNALIGDKDYYAGDSGVLYGQLVMIVKDSGWDLWDWWASN